MIWTPSTLYGWHSWFAWHPVLLNDGRMAWLETIERKFWRDPEPNYAGYNDHLQYRELVSDRERIEQVVHVEEEETISKSVHYARITELLNANNTLLEEKRALEAQLRFYGGVE